jgi:hypothetical protein
MWYCKCVNMRIRRWNNCINIHRRFGHYSLGTGMSCASPKHININIVFCSTVTIRGNSCKVSNIAWTSVELSWISEVYTCSGKNQLTFFAIKRHFGRTSLSFTKENLSCVTDNPAWSSGKMKFAFNLNFLDVTRRLEELLIATEVSWPAFIFS